jgi:multidrug efflux system membrane fusion protein
MNVADRGVGQRSLFFGKLDHPMIPSPPSAEPAPVRLRQGDMSDTPSARESPRSKRVPAPPVESKPVPRAPRQRWLLSLVILILLGVGGYVGYPTIEPYLHAQRAVQPAPPRRVIPVVTATVARADMPISINGLGTATASKTVTVRSRIEGELIRVAFEEGQAIREGDILAEVDPRPYRVQLKEAEAQLLKDEAALRVALSDYDRYAALVASRTVTQQQLDTQRATVQQTQAAIQADQGRIESIRLQLSYCTIHAPISGRIGLRTVDAGNIVRTNDPGGLAVITQVQPIAVVFPVAQDDIAAVQNQLRAGKILAVDAFDRSFRTKLASGVLTAIDNQVDVATGTVKVKADFSNDDGMLFPNQFVNARLVVDTVKNAIVAPTAAIQQGPETTYVYVLEGDSTVDLRPVVVGPSAGDRVIIERGLEPGEVVVIDGVDKLTKGTTVAPRSSDASDPKPPVPEPPASVPRGA